jgi:hypothetical protein
MQGGLGIGGELGEAGSRAGPGGFRCSSRKRLIAV